MVKSHRGERPRKRRDSIASGTSREDERKRTVDDVPKAYVGVETGEWWLPRDQHWRCLPTDSAAPGTKAA